MKLSQNSPPSFPHPEGEFSVDYRNHNGKIVLGMDDWSFVTDWSTGGAGIIHVMNDPPGIRGVAVAGGIGEILQVTDAVFASANFTSRHRTPRTGQVVLFENTNGYAAAVELLNITITPEGDAGTELKGRYKILTDGSRDFSASKSPIHDAIRSSAVDVLEALDEVQPEPLVENKGIGIGHNNPPDDFALDYLEHAELAGSISTLATEAKANAISHATSEKAKAHIFNGLAKIKAWMSVRAKLVEEGFFNQLGASLAFALTALSAWALLAGKLDGLLSLIGTLVW